MPHKMIKVTTSTRNALCSGKTHVQPSRNPNTYIVIASACETYRGIPRLPPTSRPSDWEMMAYAPPAPIRMFDVIDDIARPVQIVIT